MADLGRILICVPQQDQAADLALLLNREGYQAQICSHLSVLAQQLDDSVAALVLGEEALVIEDSPLPTDWSQWPLVLLAEQRDGRGLDAERAWRKVANMTTNVLVEEWPAIPRSLLCYLSTSLRCRERQVQARTNEPLSGESVLLQGQKLDALGQLTGGIAHDFNNMLTGVIGSLDLLRGRVASGRSDGLERLIDTAAISANRAAQLTQRLLKFARRRPLELRRVDLHAQLLSAEALIRHTLGETTQFSSRYEPAAAWVMVDTDELQSSLLNLALNARDAMPAGGRVQLRTELVEQVASGLPALSQGGYLQISFVDSGCGMDTDVLGKAFDPFFTTKAVGQGSGLGLSMVHGFARQSGGCVQIDSQPGAGTTVRLYLPAAAPLVEAAQPAVAHQ